MNKKIAWCITGGEYFLKEVLEFIKTLGPSHIKLFISNAGLEVIDFFGYRGLIDMPFIKENSYSGLEILGVLNHNIKKVVVAPCTSNTVAKIVNGIADSMCSTLVSQAQKSGKEVFVLPTDVNDEMVFRTKSGKSYKIKRRKIDKENLCKLEKMELFKVFYDIETLKRKILNEIT